jgi:hypothetical protein
MTNIPKEIEHYINLFKDYTDERLISITLRYAPQLEYHIAAKLLLENRKGVAQEKTNTEILEAAKNATRWAMYAFIVALLSFLAFVTGWTYEHSRSLIDKKQQIEKTNTSPAHPPSAKGTSAISNEKPHISQEQSKTKNK